MIGMSRDERIDYIVQLMVTRKWRPGLHHRKLAAEWGMHPRTVGDLACAASAVIDRIGSPLVEWIGEKMRELEGLAESAMRRKKALIRADGSIVKVDDPNHRAAIAAIKLQLEARGALMRRSEHRSLPHGSVQELEARRDQAKAAMLRLEQAIEARKSKEAN